MVETKVTQIDRIIHHCEVIDIPAGSAPKNVVVQLPGGEGARVLAWWSGRPALADGDIVKLLKRGLDGTYEVFGVDGATASTELSATLFAAKGDLITATADDTPAILTVGTDGQYLGADSSVAAGLGWQDGPPPFPALNTSGGAVVAGDVGYIDSAGEFKTTTTSALIASWVVVVVGGANGADIYVTRQGRRVLNYAGTAPDVGEYLVTSTTAGKAAVSVLMQPAVFAVCTGAGAGGTVETLLLCGTQFVPRTDSNFVYGVNNASSTNFIATINGAPSATSVVYNAPGTGTEDTIVPNSATNLGKARLHNTTRGNYRLITAVDVGTNTITTVSSTDDWASGDTITIVSPTVTVGDAYKFIELDLTQTTVIPATARALMLELLKQDSGGAAFSSLHPYKTYAASFDFLFNTQAAAVRIYRTFEVELYSRVFCWRGQATGSGTLTFERLRLMGYWEAAP